MHPVSRSGGLKVFHDPHLKLVGEFLVAERKKVINIDREDDNASFPIDDLVGDKSVGITYHLFQPHFAECFLQLVVPLSTSLPKSIQHFDEQKNLPSGLVVVVEALWDFHVDLLVEIPIEIGSLNIYVSDLPILLICNCTKQTNGFQSGDWSVCFKIAETGYLTESTSDETSFVAVSLALGVSFDTVDPFAAFSSLVSRLT